jgi:hypothetical protein
MQETVRKSFRKRVSRGLLVSMAVAGFAFVSHVHADIAISKQLTNPMKKIEGNKYRLDFILRVLNTESNTVSNLEIRDTVKKDFGNAVISVEKHPDINPHFIDETRNDKKSISSGDLHADFLEKVSPDEPRILTGAELKSGEFLAVRYSLIVDFGDNKLPLSTKAEVWDNLGKQWDTSNNGDVPANDANFPGGKAGDSETTLYFPEYDGSDYTKDAKCKAQLGNNDALESSYELIKNGGFLTKHGAPGQLGTPVAAGTLLADSFMSGALYAGDNAYPHDELLDDSGTQTSNDAQISIRTGVALHSDATQQHPFSGDPDRSFVEQTGNWLFFNGNRTDNPVDVWKQTVQLEAGKAYNFSMYVSNAAWPGSTGTLHPQIQLFAGSDIGSVIDLALETGSDDWTLVQQTFTSGQSGDVELKIINNQTGHFYNNLAITGIGLHRCIVATEDSDKDGLNDGEENELGSNPDAVDTDGDGVNDNKETEDTDGDGKKDILESSTQDTDGDGIMDDKDSDDTDGPKADKDNDGLSNADEDKLGTDKEKSDSDGDEIDDLTEVGDDIEHPKNSDGDCHIDALDSALKDSDNDGFKDQFDGNSPSCSSGGGGGGSTGLYLFSLMGLPIIMRRQRKRG